MKYLYLCLPGWIFLAGCSGTCEITRPCQLNISSLSPRLYGFTYNEIDTIIVRQFKSGTGFSAFVDSTVYDTATNGYQYDPYPPTIIKKKDETGPDSFYSVGINLLSERTYPLHDIEIEIPSARRIFRISNISSENNTETVEHGCGRSVQTGGSGCISKIFSYRLDGKLIPLYKKDTSGLEVLLSESEYNPKLVK